MKTDHSPRTQWRECTTHSGQHHEAEGKGESELCLRRSEIRAMNESSFLQKQKNFSLSTLLNLCAALHPMRSQVATP